MFRAFLVLFAGVACGSFAFAQEATTLRFKWTADEVRKYKVAQTTTVNETSIDEQTKKPVQIVTTTKIAVTKQWTVKAVDQNGTATLELAITALRQEITQTQGDEKPVNKILDSANAEDAKAMPFLGKPSLTVKMDALGQVIEAKAGNENAADRLQVELPFRITLPTDAVKADAKWDRAFTMKLPPPLGTGEKFNGTQTYKYRGSNGDAGVVGVSTEMKTQPEDAALMPALAPALWEGDVFINLKTGAYLGAKLTTKKEIPNHQGDGTKFVYQSEYTEVAEK
jgi:hypothetical protein